MKIAILAIILASEIFILFFMLRPRKKADAPSGALYYVNKARMQLAQPVSLRNYKKLLSYTTRAEAKLNRAKAEDVYDLGSVHSTLHQAKKLCSALVTVCPPDACVHFAYLDRIFSSCEKRLSLLIGDVPERHPSLKDLSRSAKTERARKLLDTVKAEEHNRIPPQ